MKKMKVESKLTNDTLIMFNGEFLTNNVCFYNPKFYEFKDSKIEHLINLGNKFTIQHGKYSENCDMENIERYLPDKRVKAIDTGYTIMSRKVNIGVFYRTESKDFCHINRALIPTIDCNIYVGANGSNPLFVFMHKGEVVMAACPIRHRQESNFKIVCKD